MKKKYCTGFAVLFLTAAFAVYGQDTGGTADILPELPPEAVESVHNVFYLHTGAALNFGNPTADDYTVAGVNGQASLKTHLNMTKSFGPLFFIGQISDTIGLSSPNTFNLAEFSLTPVLFIPKTPLMVGVHLSGNFPFYNGRLIGTPAQVPSSVPLFSAASWGIIPGLRFAQPLKWGSLSVTALFLANRVIATGDWNLGMDFEIGIGSAIGISGFISPNFSFLEMGETPDSRDMFTSFDVSIGYMKPGVPVSGSLLLTFPGSQKDGFKRFGMLISPTVHFYPHIQWDLWFSIVLQGIGNGVGDKIVVLPTIGMTYHFPVTTLPASGFINTNRNTEADAPENTPQEGDPAASAHSPGQYYISRWHIGLAGGYANNSLYTSTGERPFTEYKNGHGFEIALPVRYQVNRWFAVQTEIQYTQKNYTMQRSGEYDWMYNKTTNSFIDFPLMAHFSVGWDKFRFFANVGVYAGVWIHSRRKGTIAENTHDPFHPDYNPPDITNYYYKHDYDEKMEFDSRRDARFDGGLLAGIGVQYAFPACTLFAEGRFNYGLTDLQQNYGHHMFPRMNNTFNVRLGAMLNIDGLKSSKRGN